MAVAALVLAGSLLAPTGVSAEGAETVVLARVAAFANAFRDGDVGTIEALLGAEYSHCNSDGSNPSKEQWLSWFRTRAADIEAGRHVFDEYRNEDVQIHLHEDVAVVTAVNVSAGTRAGTPFATRLRFTQVWARENGEWKRIAFHDSRLLNEE